MLRAHRTIKRTLRQLTLLLVWSLGLLSVVATGGGDGSSPNPPPTNQAPVLSSVTLSNTSFEYLADGGSTATEMTVGYSDPEADIRTIRIEVSDGTSLTLPGPGSQSQSSGEITVAIDLATDASGDFSIEVWVIDDGSNDSNRLSATFSVLGSIALSGLEISETSLDPGFEDETYDYTAIVPATVTSVAVTATLLDPSGNLEVNGAAAPSGEPSMPIDLFVGENPITITVTGSNGMVGTYTILLTQETDASLSDLNHSAGMLDQIFQPEVLDYTGAVSFLHTTTRVTATAADPDATIEINGTMLPVSGESEPISLAEGANLVDIMVTGTDGTTSIYTIEITRPALDTFAQRAYIKASNTQEEYEFSWAVSLHGDTLVVGSPHEWGGSTGVDGDQNDQSVLRSGAVYVFVRDAAGNWSQQSYLKASNTGEHDSFGVSVALYGDTLAVGAPVEDSAATGVNGDETDESQPEAGAVYIFGRDGSGIWSQKAYVKASSTGFRFGDEFGRAVALYEDTLAVGAPGEDSAATGIDGNQADESVLSSGAVYLFDRDESGAWSQRHYVKATNTGEADFFGQSIALNADTLVVGAPAEDSAATGIDGDQSDDSASLAGAVYVLKRNDLGNWSHQAYLKASNTEAVEYFGGSVAISGDSLAVGARSEDSAATGVNGDQNDNTDQNSGAVYLFTRTPAGVWSQEAYIKASNGDEDDQFGWSVALTGNTLAVGARQESSGATGINGDENNNDWPNAGAAYLFVRDEDGWAQSAYLKASNTYLFMDFGSSVAIADGLLAVGSRLERSGATGIDGDQTDRSESGAGAVYVFK